MNEEAIFTAALEFPNADERRAYLDRACAGNPELRAQIEDLLKASDDAGSFLNHPPLAADATIALTASGDDTMNDPGWAGRLPFLEPCETPGRLGKLVGKSGEYEVIEVVGQGGMGAVLRAFESKLSRIVAVKVMAPELAANPTAVKRFLREAQTAAAVHHDHVVTIHAIDESHRPPFLVMQFIEGQTLQQKLDREGAIELNQILRIGSQMASGLAAAHKHGLIHRDVKPANILLENGVERVKITDFGLARATDDLEMTQTGVIAGTPQYMSPEQARGEPVDGRSDLFSLGSVLYTMCAGRPAFRADNTMAVLRRVCDDVPRPIHEVNPEIPSWLEAIVAKLQAKNPADRFQSAAEVAELLGQHLAHLQNPAQVTRPTPVVVPSSAKPLPVEERASSSSVVATVLIVLMLSAALPLALAVVAVGAWFFYASKSMPLKQSVRPQGMLSLELNDPQIEFRIDDYGANLTGISDYHVPLEPGEHRVWFQLGELQGQTQPFLVRAEDQATLQLEVSGGQATARWNGQPLEIQMLAGKTASLGDFQQITAAKDWVPLFNGRDLTGWIPPPESPDAWMVKDGELLGRGSNQYLYTARGDYQDFHLRAEVKINAPGDGGILVRRAQPADSATAKTGYEVQIAGDPAHVSPTASIIRHGTSVDGEGVPGRSDLIQPDQWFDLDIVAVGGKLLVGIDGREVTRLIDDVPRTQGHIALQSFADQTEIRFRTIEIAELNRGAAPPLAVAPFDADQAGAHQAAWAAHLGVPVDFTNSIGMKFRLIPPGEFLMGSTQEESSALSQTLEQKGGNDYEKFVARVGSPQHHVRITQAFYLGTYEVTVGQYRKFIEATNYTPSMEQLGVNRFRWQDSAIEPNAEQRAVLGVSWDDANEFCKWLSEEEGLTCSLPSEAQWEYACRAGTTTLWSFGDEVAKLDDHAVFGQTSFWPAEVVGSKQPNPFGLYDMHGNADEWCSDWHVRDFYALSPVDDPVCLKNPEEKNSGRVVRSGTAHSAPWWTRSATRPWDLPATPNTPKGFRVTITGSLDSIAKQQKQGSSPGSTGPTHVTRSSRVFNGEMTRGGDQDVFAIAFAPDGEQVATGHFGGSVALWNVKTGEQLQKLTGHAATVHALAFDSPGALLATGGEDSAIRIWKTPTGEETRRLEGHTGWINLLRFLQNDEILASVSWDFKAKEDNSIRLWNLESKMADKKLMESLGMNTQAAISPDEKLVAVANGAVQRVRLWNLDSESPAHDFAGFDSQPISVAFSRDGTHVAAGYLGTEPTQGEWNDPDNAVVRMWEITSGKLVQEFRGHAGPVMALEFSPDDRRMLSVASDRHDASGTFVTSSDHSLRIWDVATGTELMRIEPQTRVNVARWTPDGRAVCSGTRLWDVPALDEVSEIGP